MREMVRVVPVQDLGLNDEENIIISSKDAFQNARESLEPGQVFEWNENEYTTNRVDDILMLYTDSSNITLDTITKEYTFSVSIEITSYYKIALRSITETDINPRNPETVPVLSKKQIKEGSQIKSQSSLFT